MKVRGIGGFVREKWDEVKEIIEEEKEYKKKKYGNERVVGL